jgi:predicted nuclease of predicted toxin-antitoxin system
MIAFYTDENVDGSIVRGLRKVGIDVLTVVEDGYEGAPDPVVLDRALQLKRVLFSMDTDMLILASDLQARNVVFSGVIFARKRATPGECIESLRLIVVADVLENYTSNVVYIPFKTP